MESSTGQSSTDDDEDRSSGSSDIIQQVQEQRDQPTHRSGPQSPNDQPIVDETDVLSVQDRQSLDKDKAAIYDHPLFPLVGMFNARFDVCVELIHFPKNQRCC